MSARVCVLLGLLLTPFLFLQNGQRGSGVTGLKPERMSRGIGICDCSIFQARVVTFNRDLIDIDTLPNEGNGK